MITQNMGQAHSGREPGTVSARMEQWRRIPAELRERPQWAIAVGDKRPQTPNGRPASVSDPSTWTDFNTACEAASKAGGEVGFMLSENDPLVVIDMDVKDDTPPAHLDGYERLADASGGYVERSRSGRGLHAWITGHLEGGGCRREGVEVYDRARFMICTGDVHIDRPIQDAQPFLDVLVEKVRGRKGASKPFDDGPETESDEVILERARSAANGARFAAHFDGNFEVIGDTDHSRADMALMAMLAFYTRSNNQLRRLFLASALGQRDKATKRQDYIDRTIRAVRTSQAMGPTIEHGREVADTLFRNANVPRKHQLRLVRDGDLDALPPLRWLVKGIIPTAGIGAIYGDSGTFKSFLTLDLLAHVANGREWFGRKVKAAPAVYVPFEGQGGIPNRIKAWRLAQTYASNPGVLFTVLPADDAASRVGVLVDPLNLQDPADRDALVALLTESGDAGGVLCIDTLAHAASGLDENSSAMAEMITIFRVLQHRLGGVILLVHHSGKDQSRGMRGWSGLHAAMDFVIECKREKDSPEREAQFYLAKVKDGTTGAPTKFKMRLIQLGIDEDGDPIESLVVEAPEPQETSEDAAHALESGLNKADATLVLDQDDHFIEEWVRAAMGSGKQPTGRFLEGELSIMKSKRAGFTQKRLREAIERLRVNGRLVVEPGGPGGAKWLRAVDIAPRTKAQG